jgi:hypothetical protein
VKISQTLPVASAASRENGKEARETANLVRTACSPLGGTVICRRAKACRSRDPEGKWQNIGRLRKGSFSFGGSSDLLTMLTGRRRKGGSGFQGWLAVRSKLVSKEGTSPERRCSVKRDCFRTIRVVEEVLRNGRRDRGILDADFDDTAIVRWLSGTEQGTILSSERIEPGDERDNPEGAIRVQGQDTACGGRFQPVQQDVGRCG